MTSTDYNITHTVEMNADLNKPASEDFRIPSARSAQNFPEAVRRQGDRGCSILR